MWYVMQVRTGTEENIRCQCQRLISSDTLERCFIPYYQQKKRFQGEWHIQERILFPGYVFLITQNLEKLVESLKKVIGMTKLIGTGDEIVPLSEAEISLITKLGGESTESIVKISQGIIEGDQVHILSGPLKGLEGAIRKIDRHKRIAYLSVDMFNRTVDMKVGLEIVAKNKEKNNEH
ncbi:antiterminator LoaP [Blautia sp.]